MAELVAHRLDENNYGTGAEPESGEEGAQQAKPDGLQAAALGAENAAHQLQTNVQAYRHSDKGRDDAPSNDPFAQQNSVFNPLWNQTMWMRSKAPGTEPTPLDLLQTSSASTQKPFDMDGQSPLDLDARKFSFTGHSTSSQTLSADQSVAVALDRPNAIDRIASQSQCSNEFASPNADLQQQEVHANNVIRPGSQVHQSVPLDLQDIRDFDVCAGLRPRFGLEPTDRGYRSPYHDKKLIEAFKAQLNVFVRNALAVYEGQLLPAELFKLAIKASHRFMIVCLFS